MAFTREGNRDTFLRKAGYLDIEDLQRAVEDGSLLQRYDLDTSANRTRYHRQANPGAVPPVTPLIGSNSPAPNSPTYTTLDHMIVSQIDPATATSPRGVSGNGVWHTIAQYLPFRDLFYHRDKQREVAKGLEDLYKELQRVQTETPVPHPTIPGATLTTKRKLTAAEAGKIISQRRYKTVRSTLEQLAVDMGYVGEIDITGSPITPYGIPTPAATSIAYRTPTPDDIRQSYSNFTLDRTLPRKLLQAIPDEVLAGIRTVALTGIVAGATMGAYAPLAAYVGGRLTSGAATSAVSHFVRRAGRNYITCEDGLQNAAELVGRIGGLAAYSATASAIAGGLALTWVTGCLAGSTITRYVANRKRQNARDAQRQLEEITQTGADDPAIRTRIDSTILSAERYEAASAGFDIASLLGIFTGSLGSLGGIHLPWGHSTDTTAPTIDNITTQTAVKVGESAKYSFDVNDTPWTGHVENVNIAVQDPTGAVTTGTVYPLSFLEKLQHFFGDSSVTEKGVIDAKVHGQYTVTINATDHAGNSAVPQSFTINVTETTTPPGHTPGPGRDGGLTDYTTWDIRRVYHDHGHFEGRCAQNYVGGAAHENGMTFDAATHTGKINFDFNTQGDVHTQDLDSFDDTKVLFEGYEKINGVTTLTDAVLVDVDASGNFVLPQSINLNDYSGYQVIWADVAPNDATDTLCVEALASVSKGNYCNGDYLVEPEELCGGHVEQRYHAPGPEALIVPEAKPHIFDLSINEIPHNPSEQFAFTASDTYNDGLVYVVDIQHQDGSLIEHTVFKNAVGVGSARNEGVIPQLEVPGTYSIEMSGHDFPYVASDSEPRFTWNVEQGTASNVQTPTLEQITSTPAEQQIPLDNNGWNTWETGTTPASPSQSEVPIEDNEWNVWGTETTTPTPAEQQVLLDNNEWNIWGTDGQTDAYTLPDDAIAQMSYEEIQQLLQRYYEENYRIIDVKTIA